jgi:hypothetical protein
MNAEVLRDLEVLEEALRLSPEQGVYEKRAEELALRLPGYVAFVFSRKVGEERYIYRTEVVPEARIEDLETRMNKTGWFEVFNIGYEAENL